MIFISIVISLILEKTTDVNQALRRFNWLDRYLQSLQPVFTKFYSNAYFVLAIAVLVPVLVLALIYAIVGHWFFGLTGLVLSLFVLVYCLGPRSLVTEFKAYLAAKDKGDKDAAHHLGEQLAEEVVPNNGAALTRAVTRALFIQAHDRLFAVVFWFSIFGIWGAVIYRMVALLRNCDMAHISKKDDDEIPVVDNGRVAVAAQKIKTILDWVPVRVVSLMFMLVGNFIAVLPISLGHLKSGVNANEQVITDSGMAALGISTDEDTSDTASEASASDDVQDENQQAMSLIERAMVAWVVIIALITIGKVIF